MSNNFRALGLPIETQDDYTALIEGALEAGDFLPTERGGYVRYDMGHGIEVWVQVNAAGEVTGGKVHFVGESRMRLKVDHLITAEEGAEVAVYGWMGAHRRTANEAWPILCDLPGYYARAEPAEAGETVVAQIAAFARELICYPDEDAFKRAQSPDSERTADDFVPLGLFTQDADADEIVMSETPQPYAAFAGTIRGLRRVTQRRDSLDFWVLNVASNGALFDVVAAPATLDGTPTEGGIVDGMFYLSAHLLHALA